MTGLARARGSGSDRGQPTRPLHVRDDPPRRVLDIAAPSYTLAWTPWASLLSAVFGGRASDGVPSTRVMTTPLPPPPPVPPRLHWVPTLDGLRGLAVLAVVAFHAGHLQGGYLGVDLFFTVSGFLITRLILDDLGRGRFRLDLVLGPAGAPPAPRPVAPPRRDDPGLAVVDRAQLGDQPAPFGGRHRDLRRQLVAAQRSRLVLGGLRDAFAAQPHLEPGHRGAVLRGVADRRPHRLAGRHAGRPGRCWSWRWPPW